MGRVLLRCVCVVGVCVVWTGGDREFEVSVSWLGPTYGWLRLFLGKELAANELSCSYCELLGSHQASRSADQGVATRYTYNYEQQHEHHHLG